MDEKLWRRRDLNPRPKDYDSSALPLSYTANGGRAFTAGLFELQGASFMWDLT